MSSLRFCHPAISQFLIAAIFLLLIAKSRNLLKLLKLTSYFNFSTLIVYMTTSSMCYLKG